jgi:signal transduction histidine kinase
VTLLAGGLRKALPEGTELQRQAGSMESTVNRTMLEMQALLLELRPIALEDAGLVPALRELCQSYETRLGIPVAAELAPLQIPPALEHTVLRVVQEALSNAARHGQAQTIRLNLAKTDGHVVVTIQDDGQGFDVTRVSERHGMGLKTMRERVSDLGGTVDVTSVPAQGTIVRIRIPRGER